MSVATRVCTLHTAIGTAITFRVECHSRADEDFDEVVFT
jgi:hypothetical protein